MLIVVNKLFITEDSQGLSYLPICYSNRNFDITSFVMYSISNSLHYQINRFACQTLCEALTCASATWIPVVYVKG